ncbi:arginine--tRNA ligase [Ructibacterium gallinarum]|uniref:Arginine--tRNA ligase n=1 Tax=Ructibacterium gallinarum TaxID=2779355 RepID=A0A9D5LXV4_9FIRM|nr:arginine--tRNA ligase [Ructibacterium gallinarum]MBE5039946.1 arginine--tRNA ligase [Ructibacterium gallinarum]
MSIQEKMKDKIAGVVMNALQAARQKETLPDTEVEGVSEMIRLEVPRDKQHGDFACNIAMVLAKPLRTAPRKIAEAIAAEIAPDRDIEKIEVAGAGFINFYLSANWLYEILLNIEQQGEHYGKIDMGKGKKVMVEFVSANPTGPMHMGNARGGALGDCLASVLEYAGFDVTREFYINDAGNQIEKFGNSLNARYIQQLKGEDAIAFPEDGYHGEDITEHAKDFIALYGDKHLSCTEEERKAALVDYALEKNIAALKRDLEQYRIVYDVWFRESTLHESGAVQEAIDLLTQNGFTYQEDGAVWLNCEKMGLEKNEVLVRKNGIPTYFAADIAYHINKLKTRGYDWAINVWGADHHGHVARMKKALDAVGLDGNRLDVVLMQLVRLMRDGEVVRMSKRTGKAITLSDLLEDISVDAARFFFNMRSAGSHLDFDLTLAAEQSNDNPVFYVQYAHARICSILRLLEEEGVKVLPYSEMHPELLKEEAELDLLKKLGELPEEIEAAAKALEPAKITRYVMDLAAAFHTFYTACRVKVEDTDLMNARLKLIDSTRIVIKGVLTMLKITAPEKM